MAIEHHELAPKADSTANNVLMTEFNSPVERSVPTDNELRLISSFGYTALQHLVVRVVVPDMKPLDKSHSYVAWTKASENTLKLPDHTSTPQRNEYKTRLERLASTSSNYREALSAAAGYEHRYQTHYHHEDGRADLDKIVELHDQTEALEDLPVLQTAIAIDRRHNPNVGKITKAAERIVRIIGLDVIHQINTTR